LRHLELGSCLPCLSVGLRPFPQQSVAHPFARRLASVMEQVKALLQNDSAYDAMLSYRTQAPSERFLALMDLGNSDAECRLCINIADRQRRKERDTASHFRRPCACKDLHTGKLKAGTSFLRCARHL
jgi:hypothetical protein